MWMYGPILAIRELINDVDEPQKYTDNRLQRVFLMACQDVINRTDITGFSVDLESMTITPDPTEGSSRNDSFIGLALLKVVCIIANAERKKSAGSAIYIKDSASAIDLRGIGDGTAEFAKSACENYENALFDYSSGNFSAGSVILSPGFRIFSSHERNNYNPESPRA